jgi:uncharacterized protein YwqG
VTDFLRRLLGGSPSPTPPTATYKKAPSGKPPIPDAELDAFKTWFRQQTRPAIALTPDPTAQIGVIGSRLGGPAWLADGEAWPVDARGVPLEFLAQLDLAECQGLDGYPDGGIAQIFIGRDEFYGTDFEDPSGSILLVRLCDASRAGTLVAPPPLEVVAGIEFTDFSPFQDDAVRAGGIGLRPALITDRIDQSIIEAEKRIMALYERYDTEQLDAFLESDEAERPLRHHTGGYPAYTQSDVQDHPAFVEFDHVLLRLTCDDFVMWGDSGECVFLIRSDDLARADFSRVAYSWDCH